jgi:NADPH2:quinone reductase
VTYTSSNEDLRQSAAAVFGMFAKGALKISINQRYALDDVAKAHAELESGRTSGSSVLIP